MTDIIDRLKNLVSPATPLSEDTIKELQEKAVKLERQAEFAEAEARLRERTERAKKRIKSVKKSKIRPLYILAGLAFVVIIIVIIAGGC